MLAPLVFAAASVMRRDGRAAEPGVRGKSMFRARLPEPESSGYRPMREMADFLHVCQQGADGRPEPDAW
jgi:hypothetical protein